MLHARRPIQVIVSLVICAACGCVMHRARTDDTPPVSEVPRSDSSLLDEPHSLGYGIFGYDSVCFGPVGRRILDERRPEDMVVLKTTLEHTDGPRTIVVDGHLPLRQCDYALLIAEDLLGYDESPSGHSFGPRTAYEYRDDARRNALRELFRSDALPERVKYIYLDSDGEDISKKQRLVRFGP
jgi:hypothetical protein